MSETDTFLQLILSNSLKAGAIGIAITTFVIGEEARKIIAPLLFIVGTLSSFLLIGSAVISLYNLDQVNQDLISLSYMGTLFGSMLLLFHVAYIAIRLIRISVSAEVI